MSYGSSFWTVRGEDSNVFGGDIAGCDSCTGQQNKGCCEGLHFREQGLLIKVMIRVIVRCGRCV